MRRTFARSIALLFVAALAAGPACRRHKVPDVEPGQKVELVKDIPAKINRDIDVLFVVDNSATMKEEQNSLVQNFSLFIDGLTNLKKTARILDSVQDVANETEAFDAELAGENLERINRLPERLRKAAEPVAVEARKHLGLD